MVHTVRRTLRGVEQRLASPYSHGRERRAFPGPEPPHGQHRDDPCLGTTRIPRRVPEPAPTPGRDESRRRTQPGIDAHVDSGDASEC